MSKKKILRIIAVSFVIFVQCGLNNLARGMKKEDEGDKIKMAVTAIQQHRYFFSDWHANTFYGLSQTEQHPHESLGPRIRNCIEINLERRKNSVLQLPPYMNVQHVDTERVNGVNPVIASSHFLFGLIDMDIPQGCPACERAYSTISENILKTYEIKEIKRKEHKEKKFNIEQKISLIENENNNLKKHFSLFQQKYEESQKDISELKKCVTSLQEKNERLIKIITQLPSVINIEKEKFGNEISMTSTIEILHQAVCSHNKIIEDLKQKANELGQEDKNIISLSTQIITEEQVPEYCMPLLLKKDPLIFFPWKSSKGVRNLMYKSNFLSDTVLPFNILVKGQEEEVPLLSYVKEQKETDLDVNIFQKGKSNFMEMVSSIENIQGNFWKDKEGISTVPILLKKLNEGDNDKKWVPGWPLLEEDYKKYVTATVLYKRSKGFLPKRYEDIESYLMDK